MKRPSRAWRWVGAVAGIAVGCGGTPRPIAPAPLEAPSLVGGMPGRIAGFELVDTFAFPEASAGVSYRYRDSAGLTLDVYRYPIPAQVGPCAGDCLVRAAEAEVEAFRAAAPEFVRRHLWDSLVVVQDGGAAVPTGSWLAPGRHLTLRLVRQGRSYESHVAVFAGQEIFVKLRMTFAPDSARRRSALQFLAALPEAAPPEYRCPAGPLDVPGVMISSRGPRRLDHAPQRVQAALEHLGYTVAYRGEGDAGTSYWRTAPRFFRPGRPGAQALASGPSPGVVVFVVLRTAGDSSAYQVFAHALCTVPGDRAEVQRAARALEMTAVGEVTSRAFGGSRTLQAGPGAAGRPNLLRPGPVASPSHRPLSARLQRLFVVSASIQMPPSSTTLRRAFLPGTSTVARR